METYLNVHRSGRIEFSDQWEGEAICLGKTTPAERKRTKQFARLAYDGVTLLVPGIPEAPNAEAALAALRKFQGLVFHNRTPKLSAFQRCAHDAP